MSIESDHCLNACYYKGTIKDDSSGQLCDRKDLEIVR